MRLPGFRIVILWAGCLLGSVASSAADEAPASAANQPAGKPEVDADLATIASRLVEKDLATKFSGAGQYLASQNPDGTWSDIDFDDATPGS